MKPGDDPPTLQYPGRDHEGTAPRTLSGSIVSEDATTVSDVYALGAMIGRGGMGEVIQAHDRRIGRDVALKRLRSDEPTQDDIARFLREVRIQARLDHPAVVPVYELSRDRHGRPYFTMKRLAGASLLEILASGGQSRLRLLRVFVDVCRAIDFAHSRGIVHRDLKPANIVLGEFGEVYVLDWGAARVLDEDIATSDVETLEGAAPAGHVIGTPGYMPPEQYKRAEVDRAADVYALGAILFELLVHDPLHPRGPAAVASTLNASVEVSPALRRPERGVPPELDALCVAMLARDPKSRPSARRCALRVEQYVDGDRDLERRRALAIDLVWHARGALAASRRTDAMRAASRALALDPENAGAAELVTHMMLEPPTEMPAELQAMLRRSDDEDVSRHAKAAIPGYILIASFLPVLIWNGILSWSALLVTAASALGLAVAARQLMRQPQRSLAWMIVYAIGNAAMLVLMARSFTPFLVVPAVTSFITASVITYPTFLERPWVLTGVMLGALLVPIGLALIGVVPTSWQVRDGDLVMISDAMELGHRSALITVILGGVATVVMAGIQSTVLGRAKREAQHRLVAQAWHLAQLLPRPD